MTPLPLPALPPLPLHHFSVPLPPLRHVSSPSSFSHFSSSSSSSFLLPLLLLLIILLIRMTGSFVEMANASSRLLRLSFGTYFPTFMSVQLFNATPEKMRQMKWDIPSQ